MINNTIVTIKYVDEDEKFLVLQIIDDFKNDSEIFIDKQAFRFSSINTQSVILVRLIDYVKLIRTDDEPSRIRLTIFVKEDSEWNKKIIAAEPAKVKSETIKLSESFVKDLGYMTTIEDQNKLVDFLEKIQVNVQEK